MQFESFDINEFYTHLKSIIESQGSQRQQPVEQFQHKYPDKSDWIDALPQEVEPAIEIGFTPEIPQYKLIKLIGSGANGRVFLATDQSGQQCAVKIPNMWLNEDQLSRFYHEAKVLSRLSHPNIAQVKDFGDFMVADQKLPFLVMEYIPGVAIDQYVHNHSLLQDGVIELIKQVLVALQFAHHKSVIHRDIKPDNIIVKENGQPVLLDFGIATLGDDATQMLTQLTGTGDIVGTLAYMSPEQITGADKSDMRSDIYAMGVVIYQLLSGRLPISVDASQFFSAVHDIVHQTPPSLTTINHDIDDGLAAVVHHAMEKNVKQRYQSVSELINDLTAWLHHEPLSVSNLSSWYWLKQAARENKTLVTGVSLAVLGLETGLIFAVSFGLKEQQARALAERKAESNRQVVAFVNDLFINADPGQTLGETLTVKQVVQGSRYDIDQSLSPEPTVAAQIRLILGNVYQSLEMIPEAIQHYDKGLAQLKNHDNLYFQLSVQRVVALGRASLYQQQSNAIESLKNQFNRYLQQQPNNQEAKQLLNQLKLEEAGHFSVNNNPEKALTILNGLVESPYNSAQMKFAIKKNMGYIERGEGLFSQAEKRFEDLVKETNVSLGRLHPVTLDLQQELALTLRMQNRIKDALQLYEHVVAGMEKNYGDNSLPTLLARINQATAYMYGGQFEQADVMTEQLLPKMIEHVGSTHRYTVILRNIRAGALQNVGKLDAALALYQEALDLNRQSEIPDDYSHINFSHNMATIYKQKQNYEQTEAIYREIYPFCLESLGAEQPLCVIVADSYALALIKTGDIETARELLAFSNPALVKIFGENHPRVVNSNKTKALLPEATAPETHP